ncbi:MAG TPA: TonB-dependent receptor [Rhodanobacteraceae bacterium]|jgi:outer membrane receptor protein involved in Fe transport|nr:TonB-dependent receptor [Rhodanobacteraceae bacterium]
MALRLPRLVALTVVALLASASAHAFDDADEPPVNPATATELPQVNVISTTPLEGLGLPLNQIPASVQTADSAEMERQQTLDLASYLNSNFAGVTASESASNPFQLDIYYHGFTASALLGTPEGLSVYVDGVRVNEAFGDTVNWDLIPQSAISTVTLMSGSNPVFGLNTLGGSLSVRTKNGHNDPGTELEAYAGSFGRRSLEGQTGGAVGNFDYFFAGNYFDEDGWRDGSPSKVYQGFGKIGWQNEKTDIDLSYTYADTSLFGNGALPESMLAFRRQASYTPDFTDNLLNFVNLTGTQYLTDTLLLSGNAYYRHLKTNAGNGNVNDSYLTDDYDGAPIDCSLPPANRAELTYCSPGQDANSTLLQSTRGFGIQLTDSEDVFGWTNQAIVGAEYTDSDDTFSQLYQYGDLASDRSLIYLPSPFNDQKVISVSGSNKISGMYLTDTLSPSSLVHLTFSLRYNRNTETLDGYSIDSDVSDDDFDQPTALNGRHTFSRLNPALGITITPNDALTLYASYNEASRTPTVIELGCANPEAPCGLPNDFASDPALQQVVARTGEIGARGDLADRRMIWSADVFRTVNSNDLEFVAASTNAGFFDNVGNTRRQGLDLALGGKAGGLHWRVAYSFVDATYQSTFEVNAEANSTADADGNIVVHPGDRIPLIPRHTGRVILDYDLSPEWNVGGQMIASSGSFLHGNENNANRAGDTNAQGTTPTGSGRLAGYAVFNLQTTFHVTKNIDLFGRLVNVFDRDYATAGFLTTSSFNPDGSFIPDPDGWSHENAVSPAAPRTVWGGIRLRFD